MNDFLLRLGKLYRLMNCSYNLRQDESIPDVIAWVFKPQRLNIGKIKSSFDPFPTQLQIFELGRSYLDVFLFSHMQSMRIAQPIAYCCPTNEPVDP